jgi:hypothetical protein
MTAMRYDPDWPLVVVDWSQLDEFEQIKLVAEHHRRARIRLPNLRLYAGLHGSGGPSSSGDETLPQPHSSGSWARASPVMTPYMR